ncbi:MAG: rRNA pseudouridine synthase, partial [Mesorhizobium sp.]
RPKGDFSDRPKRDFGDLPKRDFAGDRPQGASGGFKSRPRPAEATEEAGERIAKRLARAGLASRRDAEELIAAGRVKVNGRVLSSPAFNVMPGDIIHLDGMEIPPIERTRLFLFHKPTGVVTTNRDPEGRKTVFDVLPADLPRLITNDGGLARVLELPATGWLRRYRVRVHGKVEESALAGLREGIAVDGVFYGAIEATLDREQGSNAWLTLGLREGKNREVRNILGSLGLDVTRLIRISYGPFQLDDLPEGHVLEIKGR